MKVRLKIEEVNGERVKVVTSIYSEGSADAFTTQTEHTKVVDIGESLEWDITPIVKGSLDPLHQHERQLLDALLGIYLARKRYTSAVQD